jgi:hypothetical protein
MNWARHAIQFQRVAAILYADARECLRDGDTDGALSLQASAARFAKRAQLLMEVRSDLRPKCIKCGLEDGACICAHLSR